MTLMPVRAPAIRTTSLGADELLDLVVGALGAHPFGADAVGAGNLGDVDGAGGVDADAVRRDEVAGRGAVVGVGAPAGNDAAFWAEDGDASRLVDVCVAVDE